MASGLTAPRIVAERTIAQLERMLASPIEQSPIVRRCRRSPTTPTASRSATSSATSSTRPTSAFLDTLRGDYLAATREDPGPLVGAQRRGALPRRDPLAGRRSTSIPRDVHQIGLDELGPIEAERRAIARAAGFGDDTDAYRAALAADPANQAATQEELVARATEDIDRAGDGRAPRVFGHLPAGRLRGPPGRGVQGEGRPVRLLLPADHRTARAPASTTSTPTTCRAARTRSSRPTTYHEAIPGHHFQISLEMENPTLNVFRRLGSRLIGGGLRRGLGPLPRAARRRDGPVPQRGERFGHARRAGLAGRRGWSSTPACTRLRWSRQRVDRLLLRTGLLGDRRGHRDRPLHLWPGQALTLHDRAARDPQAAARARGARRLRVRPARFHDELLGHGSLPLATLARELPTWVRRPADAGARPSPRATHRAGSATAAAA